MNGKQPNQERRLHGNNAKIDPTKHVESLYATNMAAGEKKTADKDFDQKLRDEMVEYARRFVEENKK